MFHVSCQCGCEVAVEDDRLNCPLPCRRCGKAVICLAAEAVDDAAALGDFDAALQVVEGPSLGGTLIRLGGCVPITLGKQAGNTLLLPGTLVSRAHCELQRVEFGPSRWRLVDKGSTNGLFVNGWRVKQHELAHGDRITVGEFSFSYLCDEAAAQSPVAAISAVSRDAQAAQRLGAADAMTTRAPSRPASRTSAAQAGGKQCPSCDGALPAAAKVCVDCGINIASGRPLVTSEALDENIVYGNSEVAISIMSWLVWVTPLPIPLASAAYGKNKPYAIWTIVALTVLFSLIFFIANIAKSDGRAMANLMLWPASPDVSAMARSLVQDPQIHQQQLQDLHEDESEAIATLTAAMKSQVGEFHWYQLFTHAMLHDSSSLLNFALHLGGNMLFMIVFGSRVNAIIGNAATAIIYPILAVSSAAVYLLTLPASSLTPMLGASGAINGLAGLYLVLFPAQIVYCAMWLRIRTHLALKIFSLRGFWILLIYFAFDLAMVALGSHGHTAHWAHIGGFATGALIGLILIFSRQFRFNGDLISLCFGKYAWPLIGKPSRRAAWA